MGSVAEGADVLVSEHAMWRAAERFPWFDVALIEGEVRDALAAGRYSTEKPAGLHPPDDPDSLYVWDPTGARVYALRVDRDTDTRWVVTTTMKPATIPILTPA